MVVVMILGYIEKKGSSEAPLSCRTLENATPQCGTTSSAHHLQSEHCYRWYAPQHYEDQKCAYAQFPS